MAAALNSEMLSRVPLIIVVGATGTGKTKLSVELAKKFGGEIINADSMQVYSGLDILTNKATEEERAGVPHHLLGHLTPGDDYNVHRFRKEAFSIIERLHAQNKVPVIVGGTHYYVESILWKNLVAAKEACDGDDDDDGGGVPRKKSRVEAKKYVIAGREFDNLDEDLEKLSIEELRAILKEIDPVSWKLHHDANRRRISRSIQVFGQTGRRHSDILEEQRREAGSVYGGSLRYPNAVVFWMQCDKDVLRERVSKRVDEMLERGLLEEVDAFHREVNLLRGEERTRDFEKSLFQSIGFKELMPFVSLAPEERASEKAKKVLSEGEWLLKQRTMNYANRQVRWIKNRLLVHNRDVPAVWPLDGTDPSRWEELVAGPARAVVEARLRGEDPDEALIRPAAKERAALPPEERHMTYRCAPCGRPLIGLEQYNAHLASKKHRKVEAAVRRAQREVVDTLDRPVREVVDTLDRLVREGREEEPPAAPSPAGPSPAAPSPAALSPAAPSPAESRPGADP